MGDIRAKNEWKNQKFRQDILRFFERKGGKHTDTVRWGELPPTSNFIKLPLLGNLKKEIILLRFLLRMDEKIYRFMPQYAMIR